MTEINYLPPVEKTKQEIQLDFMGPIRFKHRRFYIILSVDRYGTAGSRRRAFVKRRHEEQQKKWNKMLH